ncbi:asparagine synthase (glutamine-hydrolyzing) [Vibrio europaeus]|uniref:asparagine synthase (glutamine-hydrolyzing) n=1 Tax=Vibrio europaeus TaxID=300876 RepID=UPI002341161B|nr:asparagine synthase (glutamine-hydrolyzing) [Vibrio europaeus]MDC5850447.1 asparagine synthase (glutamine-hydrolyzing) [Vibrio europaeus]
MCGIVGYLSYQHENSDILFDNTTKMADALITRGPDSHGIWLEPELGLGLGHRRLAIQDLSEAGHQPMISNCGRFTIVFNGEIYNHNEIRSELETLNIGYTQTGWRGHSDTETLLAALSAWGIEKSLQKLVGMFAFALWDKQKKTLTLARDRIGEKPLYYGLVGHRLFLGSELKALMVHPSFNTDIDSSSLSLLLRYNNIGFNQSILSGVKKLPPGTWLEVTESALRSQRLPVPSVYWSLAEVAQTGISNPFEGDEKDAVYSLDSLLKQSISGQMISDVQLGAFLSGGIDSTTIVSMLQSLSNTPVKTFTIGFNEAGYNEADHAREIANYLGTDHSELFVSEKDMLDSVARLPSLYSEPFADVSQIPTFLVSEMAAKEVRVSLSGDAGDELFGGYNRYFRATSIWKKLGWLPRPFRLALAGAITSLPPSQWNTVFKNLERLVPSGWRYSTPGDKLHKLADMLAVRCPEDIYSALVSHWKPTELNVVRGVDCFTTDLTIQTDSIPVSAVTLEERMMFLDSITYLPDDILAKVDRAAMGVSLETRVPFLDHRVVEFAWTLPLSMKIRQGEGKWLVRQVLGKHVPIEMVERPKTGFSVPIDSWLRGPLKGWASELLDPTSMNQQGFFESSMIERKWREHLSGERNNAHQLWSVLMYQSWFQEHIN